MNQRSREEDPPLSASVLCLCRNWPGLEAAGMNTDAEIDGLLKTVNVTGTPNRPNQNSRRQNPNRRKLRPETCTRARTNTKRRKACADPPGRDEDRGGEAERQRTRRQYLRRHGQRKRSRSTGSKSGSTPGNWSRARAQAAVKSPEVGSVKLKSARRKPEVCQRSPGQDDHDGRGRATNGGKVFSMAAARDSGKASRTLSWPCTTTETAAKKSQRKVVWISEKKGLIKDAKRDFHDGGRRR